jgi:solute carrier family 5 (sodium-coupled monocarboxylate transporter), member 8/12
MAEDKFRIEDYLVVVLMLLISVAIGIYYRFTGGKQKTVKVCICILESIQQIIFIFSTVITFLYARRS